MFRGALVVALILAVMVAVKDGRLLREAGLLSTCTTLSSYEGQTGYWHACREGRLEGRPDLSRRSCESHGVRGGYEYWRCPEHIGTAARRALDAASEAPTGVEPVYTALQAVA